MIVHLLSNTLISVVNNGTLAFSMKVFGLCFDYKDLDTIFAGCQAFSITGYPLCNIRYPARRILKSLPVDLNFFHT